MSAVHHPDVHELVEQQVREQNIQAPYAVNLILLACWEWDIHRRMGGQEFTDLRSVLQANLHWARECLHERALPIAAPPVIRSPRPWRRRALTGSGRYLGRWTP